jgi:hypothetical protein
MRPGAAGSFKAATVGRAGKLWSVALVLSCLTGAGAQAVPFTHYGFSGTHGVFSVSCSGPGDGGLPNSGNVDNRGFFKPGSDCSADPLTSAASSTFNLGSVTASGSASAGLGALQGAATMATGAQSAVFFPAGFFDMGWIDTLTIVDPANDGNLAMVSIVLNVSGALLADGPNVFSRLQLVVSSEAAGGPNLHNPFYQIQSGGPVPQPISDTLVLDLPFVVGVPSQFLVRGMGVAMTSSQTSFGDNVADLDFLSTVSWGGIRQITIAGARITPDEVRSASGVDWTRTLAVPEAPTWTLLLPGLAALAFLRRPARS